MIEGPTMHAIKMALLQLLADPEVQEALRNAMTRPKEPEPERPLPGPQIAKALGLTPLAWRKRLSRNPSLELLGSWPGRSLFLLSQVQAWRARYEHDRHARRAANDKARIQLAARREQQQVQAPLTLH